MELCTAGVRAACVWCALCKEALFHVFVLFPYLHHSFFVDNVVVQCTHLLLPYQSCQSPPYNTMQHHATPYNTTHTTPTPTQDLRIDALYALREFRLRVVVTTDLVARGIDLERVNLVVNLDLPPDAPTYLHRVGRSGRFGGRGLAVTCVRHDADVQVLRGWLAQVGPGTQVCWGGAGGRRTPWRGDAGAGVCECGGGAVPLLWCVVLLCRLLRVCVYLHCLANTAHVHSCSRCQTQWTRRCTRSRVWTTSTTRRWHTFEPKRRREGQLTVLTALTV